MSRISIQTEWSSYVLIKAHHKGWSVLVNNDITLAKKDAFPAEAQIQLAMKGPTATSENW